MQSTSFAAKVKQNAFASSRFLKPEVWSRNKVVSPTSTFSINLFYIMCMSFKAKLNTQIGAHFIAVICERLQKRFSMIWASISTFPRPAMRHKRCCCAVWSCNRAGSGKARREWKWCSGAWCKMALESIPRKIKNPWQNQVICQINFFWNFPEISPPCIAVLRLSPAAIRRLNLWSYWPFP